MFGRITKMSAAGAMAGVGAILLQPDATLARSKSGEKGAVSRSWVRPTHVTMGRELADARFSKGSWWMWQYSDAEGKPYSWERYSVVAVDGDEVLIDMASTLREEEPFATHHRMHLSLAEVLSASDDHRQWKFRTFGYLRDGRWLEAPSNDNVQAFEEKFNEFLMAPASRRPWFSQKAVTIESDRRCDVAPLGEATLVQSARHAYTGAWYVQAPAQYAGVAGLKYFGVEGGRDTYRFDLVALGSEEADDSPMPNHPCCDRAAPHSSHFALAAL